MSGARQPEPWRALTPTLRFYTWADRMAGPFDFTERIVNLSSVVLASLMRRVLQLEAARLNLPYGSSSASQRVTVADEGEDGIVLSVPEDLQTRLPAGNTLLQFKTNRERKTVEGRVLGELDESPRPMKMLETDGSYVVVWSKDAVGTESDALRKAIREKVGTDYEDNVDVWSVGVIEELLTTNPAVLIEFGMVGGMSVLTFGQWAPGERQSIPDYVPDQERSELIEQLQRVIIEETGGAYCPSARRRGSGQDPLGSRGHGQGGDPIPGDLRDSQPSRAVHHLRRLPA